MSGTFLVMDETTQPSNKQNYWGSRLKSSQSTVAKVLLFAVIACFVVACNGEKSETPPASNMSTNEPPPPMNDPSKNPPPGGPAANNGV
jgi:hypothetical protein